ncbi:MAG TPA: hypothetical protein VNZ64_03215 [Candidatus Acidoferrum sp.]|nr:hypothetical protein [Candidatus Acidoferrum sp.]
MNGLRLALGLILLPLVLRKLPTAELGMYYVLLSLGAITTMVDFGFAPTLARFVSYAMGGAEAIQAQGVAKAGSSTSPNYHLLWELLYTTRTLYRFLTLALLLILAIWGTYVVELRIHETASPALTRLAWGATLVGALWDIYSNWWEIYLRSMNEVVTAARIAVLATTIRLVLAAVLLVCGWGLLSLPIGTLVGALVQRQLARRRCLALLAGHPTPERVEVKKNLSILWPNAWRVGVQCFGGYLTVNANTAICLQVLGLVANARYGLSNQLLSIATGMAWVWTLVKWPVVGQYYSQHDFGAIQRVLRPRLWLQNLSFLAMAAFLLLCGPPLLERFGSGKQVLPAIWFGLLGLNSFLEMQFTFWGTAILLGNRLPYLWHSVGSNVLSLVLSLALIHFTSLGLGALVLGPLVAGCLLNYWYWPLYGARSLGTTLFRFLLGTASRGVGVGAGRSIKPHGPGDGGGP